MALAKKEIYRKIVWKSADITKAEKQEYFMNKKVIKSVQINIVRIC